MRKLRWPVRIFVVAVLLTASATLALAAILPADGGSVDPVLILTFGIVATVANLQVVHVSAKSKVTVGGAAVFAAVLTLVPLAAMAIGGASVFVGLRFSTRQPLYNRLFNAAATVLAAGTAAVVYRSLAQGAALLEDPLAVVASAVTYYLVKVTITDVVVALQLHRDPVRGWWTDHRREIWHHAALYLLGILAAVAAERERWTLALFLVPIGLVLLALREATKLRQSTKSAIIELADLIDQRDPYTYGHSQRVAELSRQVARRLGLASERVDLITEAARMHDIGKVTIPDHILKKPGPLDSREWSEMRKHCESGHVFLHRLPDFSDGAELVLSHHERVDGSGYPRRLRGPELPLEASVIAVCDAYDAMTTDRVYRQALAPGTVLAELAAGSGTQWHTRAVDALLALVGDGALSIPAVPAPAATAS